MKEPQRNRTALMPEPTHVAQRLPRHSAGGLLKTNMDKVLLLRAPTILQETELARPLSLPRHKKRLKVSYVHA
jgi:hypothetical protein